MRRRNNMWATVGNYLGLAFLLPLSTFIGYAIGYYLDKAFGTSFLYLVFLLLGIAAGLIEVIRQFNRDSKHSGS